MLSLIVIAGDADRGSRPPVGDGAGMHYLAIVGVAAALSLPASPLVAGATLLFGCLGVLLTNVLGSARR